MFYLMKSKNYAIFSNIKVMIIERSAFWDTRYNCITNVWLPLWYVLFAKTLQFKMVSVQYRRLRAKRALVLFNDVSLRARRALSPQTLSSDNALLVRNGTSLNNINALLALNWRYDFLCMSIFTFQGKCWCMDWRAYQQTNQTQVWSL